MSRLNLFAGRVILFAVASCAGVLQAEVKLPAIFSDHMVLQSADKVPVWGWANAGEQVKVTIADVEGSAKTGADGKWKLELDLSHIGQGPFAMVVSGENRIEISDVLVGQVWLASGQSNMEWPLRSSIGAEAEPDAHTARFVREFRIDRAGEDEVQQDVSGKWLVADAATAPHFSGVGYFFAKKLSAELGQPVGIIHSSWGGSVVESWTSAQGLEADEELKQSALVKNRHIASMPQLRAQFLQKLLPWLKANGVEDSVFAPAESFYTDDVDTAGWARVNFGSRIAGEGLPERGVIWLRRNISVSPQAAGQNLTYQIQDGNGFATFYWNGHRFHGPEQWTEENFAQLVGQGNSLRVTIPGEHVRAGANTFAIRMYSPLGVPGSTGFRAHLRGPAGFETAPHTGWFAKAEKAFDLSAAALTQAPKPVQAPSQVNRRPSRLFNGMIAPLVPYRIAGVIWYQGETNSPRAWQYRTAFPLLIEDWRKQWGEPELPFYFCQLANYRAKVEQPGQSNWAELREAQTLTLRLPNTGQAVLIDVGEANDIHPRNKQPAGERLALLALANHYDMGDVVSVGPTLENQTVKDGKVRLTFSDNGAGSELVAQPLGDTYLLKTYPRDITAPLVLPSPESQLQGFAICGADGKWVWAQARIDGEHSVVVWSPQVPEPVAVRYAWSENPTCNLYNAAGLPAVPFRTDSFELQTANARY